MSDAVVCGVGHGSKVNASGWTLANGELKIITRSSYALQWLVQHAHERRLRLSQLGIGNDLPILFLVCLD